MPGAILTLNAGSSSLKFSLYEIGRDALNERLVGQIEKITSAPHMLAKNAAGAVVAERSWQDGPRGDALLAPLLDWVDDHLGEDSLAAVGHRVVHGGARFVAPARVDDAVLAALDALAPLAPLHQPHNLAASRAVNAARPDLPQVACFDTAFHHAMAPVATRFALTRALEARGVRRYGFHGLSYEYIAGRLATLAPALAAGRVIVAHLGNGASLCAMAAGRSVDTTMGFTALDGLVMGTRCGDLDPGVILYLLQNDRMDAAAIEDLLYNRSGLLGVSGVSSDMRTLLASNDPAAREAVDLFVYRIARESGALASCLGGLDGFVFTAGIGENAPLIRQKVCECLAWLGADLDLDANRQGAGLVSTPTSRLALWVIPTDEEQMIAAHTRAFV